MPTQVTKAGGRRSAEQEPSQPSVGSVALSIGVAIGPALAAVVCLRQMTGWAAGGSIRIESASAAVVAVAALFSIICALFLVRSVWIWFSAVTVGLLVALPTIAGIVHGYEETTTVPAAMGVAAAAGVLAGYSLRPLPTRTSIVVLLGVMVWLSMGFGFADLQGADVRGLYDRNQREWLGVLQLAGIAGHPNSMGLTAGMTLLLQLLWLLRSTVRSGARVLLWLVGPIASFTALLWAQSRTAWIATGVAAGILVLTWSLKRWTWVPGVVLSLVALAVVILPWRDFGLHGRWYAWEVVREALADNWMLGRGPYLLSPEFWDSWKAAQGEVVLWEPAHAHNQFLASLGLLGLVGAAICLLTFFIMIRIAGKVRLADFGWTIAAVALLLLYSGPEVTFGVADVSATYLPVLVLVAVLGLGWQRSATARAIPSK
jgi:hypothetical protein